MPVQVRELRIRRPSSGRLPLERLTQA